MGKWKITTAAATAVLTTAEAKAFLRVDSSDEDTLIDALIAGATQHAQNYLEQAFVTQTVTEKFDELGSVLRLSVHPVISITSIQYIDENGDTQTLAADQYNADTYAKRAVIEPAYGVSWPTVRPQRNAVTVVYQAGYGSADNVPEDIKLAIRQIVADAFDNRQDSVKELPTSSKYLLDRVNYTYLL